MLADRVALGFHLAACRRCRLHLGRLIATVDGLCGTSGAPGAPVLGPEPRVTWLEPAHHGARQA